VARGWESKSIEEQQAEFSQNAHQARQKLTIVEAAQRRESENLRLARIRILRQIDSATSPRYRELLEKTLRDLDQRLHQQ
jgi:hypothetical protein